MKGALFTTCKAVCKCALHFDKPEFADHLEDSLFGKGVLRFPAFDFVAW